MAKPREIHNYRKQPKMCNKSQAESICGTILHCAKTHEAKVNCYPL